MRKDKCDLCNSSVVPQMNKQKHKFAVVLHLYTKRVAFKLLKMSSLTTWNPQTELNHMPPPSWL